MEPNRGTSAAVGAPSAGQPQQRPDKDAGCLREYLVDARGCAVCVRDRRRGGAPRRAAAAHEGQAVIVRVLEAVAAMGWTVGVFVLLEIKGKP